MTATIEIESELVELARNAARRGDRTEAQQIADWARLGMSLEMVTTADTQARIRDASAADLDRALEAANTPEAQERTRRHLKSLGVPLYSSDPGVPNGIIEHLPDGTSRAGRMEGRTFVPTVSPANTRG